MKRKLLTKFCIIASIITISFAGCKGDNSNKQQSDDTSINENEENKRLTPEEYKEKINEIYTSIQTEIESAATNLNSTDLITSNNARKALSEKLKPIYEQLTVLNAPEDYTEAQEKIKVGAETAIEALNLSIQMINLGTEVTTEQQAELTAQMDNLIEKMKVLNEGISMIPE